MAAEFITNGFTDKLTGTMMIRPKTSASFLTFPANWAKKCSQRLMEKVHWSNPAMNCPIWSYWMGWCRGICGFETCRQLKSNNATKYISVIFITGLTETINKVNFFNMCVVDYISKPFEIHYVQAGIDTHLVLVLAKLRQKLEQMVTDRTSDRNKYRPLIKLNCAELPASPNETEVFRSWHHSDNIGRP